MLFAPHQKWQRVRSADRSLSMRHHESGERFWMNALTLSPTLPFLTFSPCCFRRATSSRVSASRSTATSGPLPERNTACVGWSTSRRVAKFKPTKVFPAPGTPVTKQMHLRRLTWASSTNSSIRLEVTCRFWAPASKRAMASTECCA